ncbi:hypothetical protein [Salicibibacter kimchii]|uniref:Lipoprotein n=1 Tax=Salicibibacter kimchii TaxID=2099786 RepID=A0A345C1R0_9BACI|nr:hypothetical protein [Salicibibacter kimchii]AXF57141.1 hypothetical protein DT065_14810 [Salicibibacter kimchii]
MKWIIFLLVSLISLTGCQQSIDKSDEGEVWKVEFRAEQPTDTEESTFHTFHYMPDNHEAITDIEIVTDRGLEISRESIGPEPSITTEGGCSSCSTTPEDVNIEVNIQWADQGEDYEESLILD